MTKNPVELYFLGNRNYIQGAKVLEHTINWLQNDHQLKTISDIFVKRYKQPHEVQELIKIIPANQIEPPDTLRGNILVMIKGEIFDYKIITDGGSIPRYPDTSYCQTDYQEISDDTAKVILPKVKDFWELLKESVQLTKVFHINKYNQGAIKYKFVVGGFEKLKFFTPKPNESLEVTCQIKREFFHHENHYNQTKITIKQNNQTNEFILPFIGKKI